LEKAAQSNPPYSGFDQISGRNIPGRITNASHRRWGKSAFTVIVDFKRNKLEHCSAVVARIEYDPKAETAFIALISTKTGRTAYILGTDSVSLSRQGDFLAKADSSLVTLCHFRAWAYRYNRSQHRNESRQKAARSHAPRLPLRTIVGP